MNHLDPEHHYRRVRSHGESLFWGTLIILVGVTWLGINLGYFSSAIWYELLRLWPILLIIWGLNILVRRTPLQFLVYVTPIILVVAFAWVLVGKPMWPTFTMLQSGRLVTTPRSEGSAELRNYHYLLEREEGVAELVAQVDAGAAVVVIDSMVADSDCVAEIDYLTSRGEPEVSMKVKGSTAYVEIPQRESVSTSLAHPFPGKQEMTVHLPSDLPLDLELNAGASRVDARLTHTLLRSLQINGGAASVDIALPEVGDSGYRVGISSGAASVRIRFPQDTPLYLESTSALSAANFAEAGLTRQDDHWESASYNRQKPHAKVTIEGALSSISLSFEP